MKINNQIKEKTYEQKKQEILAPIFITHKEAEKIEKIGLKKLKSDYLELKRKFKEANIRIKNADNIFGNLLRDFGMKLEIKEESKEKEIMNKLWVFILDNTKKHFKVPLTKREFKKEKEKKIVNHLKALKKLKKRFGDLK